MSAYEYRYRIYEKSDQCDTYWPKKTFVASTGTSSWDDVREEAEKHYNFVPGGSYALLYVGDIGFDTGGMFVFRVVKPATPTIEVL